MNLGEHIIALRKQKGVSQQALAEALDVSRQSVSKWETNASIPDLDKLVKLAAYFHITLDELITGQAAAPQPPQAPAAGQAPAHPARTTVQSVGLFFLCLSAALGFLAVILRGLVGFLLVLPLFLFGLIAYFVKHHPILKALWVIYLLFSIFLHFCTGLSPTAILSTHIWTQQINYFILFMDCVWFTVILALLGGTAWTLRARPWKSTLQKYLSFGLAISVFAAGTLVPRYLVVPGLVLYQLLQLTSYIQLAGLAWLVTDLARLFWLFCRERKEKQSA